MAAVGGSALLAIALRTATHGRRSETPAGTAAAADTSTPPSASHRPPRRAPVTSVPAVMQAWPPTTLVGRHVWLASVVVQDRPAPEVLWVGPSPFDRLLVVLSTYMRFGTLAPGVRRGDTVSVRGTLAPLPPDPVAWAAQWQPDDDDVAMLERAGVYVRAGVADVQRR